MKDEQIVWNL